MRKAIQVSQRERANKKNATAKAHGEHCYVAYQHADKRSQRLIKQCVSIRVLVDEQYKIASVIEDSTQLIADDGKKLTWINKKMAASQDHRTTGPQDHRTTGPQEREVGPD